MEGEVVAFLWIRLEALEGGEEYAVRLLNIICKRAFGKLLNEQTYQKST